MKSWSWLQCPLLCLSFAKFHFFIYRAAFGHFINYSLCMPFQFFFFLLTFISQEKLKWKMNVPAFSNPWDLWSDLWKPKRSPYSTYAAEEDCTITGRVCTERLCPGQPAPRSQTSLCLFLRAKPESTRASGCAGASCQSAILSSNQIVSPALQVERLWTSQQESLLLFVERVAVPSGTSRRDSSKPCDHYPLNCSGFHRGHRKSVIRLELVIYYRFYSGPFPSTLLHYFKVCLLLCHKYNLVHVLIKNGAAHVFLASSQTF